MFFYEKNLNIYMQLFKLNQIQRSEKLLEHEKKNQQITKNS